ncbi:Sds3-like-domain-containing protein [Cunninghamella echinulata]|nr:Sds3-like-domain-containing protein [Cunninghamella echinulata]
MPLASMLETNKPFVFASHSNSSSTELSPTSATPTTSTTTSTTISNNNNSVLPHSPHTTNAKLSSSATESNPYYSSSIPNDYESYNEETRHQQQSLNNNTLPSTSTNDTTSEALLDSHNNQGQENRANGYIYSLKKVTSYPSNSQLPSPATPTSVSSMSNTTSIKSITTSLPPVSSTLTSTNKISAPPVTQRHTFNTSLSTHHQPPPIQQQQLRHQDTSLSLPPPQPTSHGLHSRQVFHTMDPLHNNIKMEESSLLNSSHILHSSSSIVHSAIIPPPPTKQAAVSSISTSQDEEGDSGYIDTSASDNRRVKRRKELNQRIELLNNDFLQNKERIFTEKLLMIQNEINQAHNFTHRKYKEGLLLLESIRQKTINDSRLFRDYQTEVTDRQFTLEIHQAEEEYMAEKHEVREKLFAVLEEKRRKLKEDKDNCDLSYDVVLETQTRMNKRSLRKRGMDNGDNKTNRRKQVSGPALVFRLKEEEVYDDLQAMRSGLLAPSKKTSSYKKK